MHGFSTAQELVSLTPPPTPVVQGPTNFHSQCCTVGAPLFASTTLERFWLIHEAVPQI